MSESAPRYLVRDPSGNVYGPADGPLLRDWVLQGRIIPGMAIADESTREWIDASLHPEVAGVLQNRLQELQSPALPSTADPQDPYAQPPADTIAPNDMAGVRRDDQTLRRAADRIGVNPQALRDLRTVDVLSGNRPPARNNLFGTLSLIFGIAAIVTSCGGCVPLLACAFLPLSCLFALAALILGLLAYSQIRAAPDEFKNKPQTITGLTMGAVILSFWTLLLILGIVLSVFQKGP